MISTQLSRREDRSMSDEVRLVPPEDGDADEAWDRLTDEPEIRGVDAAWLDGAGGWQVSAWVLEFVADDPLEAELRQRVHDVLEGVEGVTDVGEYDRESWFVSGTPSGRELTEAVAVVVDELADRTRPFTV
jgi:hypothetical protein